MKQVLQDARSGEITVAEVPAPQLLAGCILVRIAASLVSSGTERASSEFASKSLLHKAISRPDLVREVVSKVRRDGLLSAVTAVRSRLDHPTALGYSSAGTVIATADGISDLRIGDRVACAGAGYAIHGELACVPRLLVAKIPTDATIDLEEAAFTTVGAVALHGIRIADVRLGEVVAVIGLGLLGQLTVQLLQAAGCRVVGLDLIPERAALARSSGALAVSTFAPEFEDLCRRHSAGYGADAVLITAETASSDPVNLAGAIARDRGIVVAVGTIGMEIQRQLFYDKELDFRVSRSYGPGRYDSAYEQKGRDYPIGYVRWTETRNMEAFLRILGDGKLDVKSLITHRFPIQRAEGAYELITGRTTESFLGVLITYPESPVSGFKIASFTDPVAPSAEKVVRIGLLGAGVFASTTLLPAIKGIRDVQLQGVCAANGAHSRRVAEKFGFRYCASGQDQILHDPEVNTIVIATRDHQHALQVGAAFRAGKHVFCEKPLCTTENELVEVIRARAEFASSRGLLLMVGFNRRFAPMTVRLKEFLAAIDGPVALHYRVNPGLLSPDHWTNDPEQGGGRIVGEGCHFIDLLTFLAGAPPTEVHTRSLAKADQYAGDNVIIGLHFANGSQGTVSYVSNGDKAYSKERLEVFGGGAVAVMEDFRRLELVRHGRKQVEHSRYRQDKGHRGEWLAFADAILNGKPSPISFAEIITTTLATLRAVDSFHLGQPVAIDVAGFLASGRDPAAMPASNHDEKF